MISETIRESLKWHIFKTIMTWGNAHSIMLWKKWDIIYAALIQSFKENTYTVKRSQNVNSGYRIMHDRISFLNAFFMSPKLSS